MSDDLGDFFALPAFKPDEALVKLRRDLRELKALAEKGTGAQVRFDWKGLPAVELGLKDLDAPHAPIAQPALAVAMAKKPSQRPDWVRATLASSAEIRKWLDELKRQLKRWEDED